MPIDIQGFTGIRPAVGKELLSNEAAQVAENCRLEGGDIEPWKAPLQVLALTSLNPVVSIYRFDINSLSETEFWFQFTTDVDVVKGPVPGDTEERTYWTDGSFPKKANAALATGAPPYPSNALRLGIPAPTSAPSVAISGAATNPDDPANTAAWGVTFVTAWGEEGPMSPLSSLQTWRPGQTPNVSGLEVAPTGPYLITGKRLYRSNSGTDTTDLQFVTELPIATTTFSDTVASSALGAVSATRRWTPPPDSLKGLCVMAGEILCGFYENSVRLSEPGVPYAWPQRYEYTFDAPIVGIMPFASALLVCTKRGTYILDGTDPAAMNRTAVTAAGNCVSKRGMVPWQGGVAYPTTRGLQFVGPDGAKLLTEGAFDELKWAAYNPSSFLCAAYQDRLIAFYDTGAKQGHLMFSMGSDPAITEGSEFATAVFTEKRTGELYIVQSNNIKRWSGGAVATWRWRSKEYVYTRPMNMAWARVQAEGYPVTFRWIVGGTTVATVSIADGYATRIPEYDDSFRGTLEIEGTGRVTRVSVTETMQEMMRL